MFLCALPGRNAVPTVRPYNQERIHVFPNTVLVPISVPAKVLVTVLTVMNAVPLLWWQRRWLTNRKDRRDKIIRMWAKEMYIMITEMLWQTLNERNVGVSWCVCAGKHQRLVFSPLCKSLCHCKICKIITCMKGRSLYGIVILQTLCERHQWNTRNHNLPTATSTMFAPVVVQFFLADHLQSAHQWNNAI